MLNNQTGTIDATPPLYGGGVESAGGGGGQTQDHQAPRVIVGNSPAGDTAFVCDILDTGNGAGIAAALALGGDVYLRPGIYDLGAAGSPGTLNVPSGGTLWGPGTTARSGLGAEATARIVGSPTTRQAVLCGSDANIHGLNFVVTQAVPGAVGTAFIRFTTLGNIHDIRIDLPNGSASETLTAVIFGSQLLHAHNIFAEPPGEGAFYNLALGGSECAFIAAGRGVLSNVHASGMDLVLRLGSGSQAVNIEGASNGRMVHITGDDCHVANVRLFAPGPTPLSSGFQIDGNRASLSNCSVGSSAGNAFQVDGDDCLLATCRVTNGVNGCVVNGDDNSVGFSHFRLATTPIVDTGNGNEFAHNQV